MTPPSASSSHRQPSMDQLRGFVMIVMTLDHARSFFSGFSPATDLSKTTAALFFTRWVTHFCAPVFIFLAGMGIFLYSQQHDQAKTTRFLWTRALWLIALELTIIRFAWAPEPFYRFVPFGVIWVIGLSMLCMAVMLRLPYKAILAIGLIVILGHNLLDGLRAQDLGSFGVFWKFLHERGAIMLGERRFLVLYPLIPWLGVMALGYTAGAWMSMEPTRRQKQMLLWGGALSLAFVALRALPFYGDPSPWRTQSDGLWTLLSFLNTTKYPPSLQFLLMTLGPSLFLLAALDRWPRLAFSPILSTFGRVPFFFYILHLYLLRFSAGFAAYLTNGIDAFRPPPGPAGSPLWPLWASYLAWLIALCLLYPLCRRFAQRKATSTTWWVRYL